MPNSLDPAATTRSIIRCASRVTSPAATNSSLAVRSAPQRSRMDGDPTDGLLWQCPGFGTRVIGWPMRRGGCRHPGHRSTRSRLWRRQAKPKGNCHDSRHRPPESARQSGQYRAATPVLGHEALILPCGVARMAFAAKVVRVIARYSSAGRPVVSSRLASCCGWSEVDQARADCGVAFGTPSASMRPSARAISPTVAP